MCDGKRRWNGKRKPVTLVATVVQRKSLVQPSNRFAVSIPNKTTKPAPIPARLNTTCRRVNNPKIMRFLLLNLVTAPTLLVSLIPELRKEFARPVEWLVSFLFSVRELALSDLR